MRKRFILLFVMMSLLLAGCGTGEATPTATLVRMTVTPRGGAAVSTVPPTVETPEATLEAAQAAVEASAEATEAVSESTLEVTQPAVEMTSEAAQPVTETTTEPTAEPTAEPELTQEAMPEGTPEAVAEASAEATAEATPAPEATVEATAEATTSAEATAVVSQGTVWELVSADPQFSILTEAIEVAGLVDTASAPAALTVFAPTNAAFEALGADVLDALLRNPPLTMMLLGYHALDFPMRSDMLQYVGFVTTLQGSEIAVSLAEDGVLLLNGTARVVTADIEATNGIIHVIDTVLLPQDVTPQTIIAQAPPPPVTIIDVASADPNFSTFVAAVDAAGLTETLDSRARYTVFMPTNAAFEALPAGVLDALLADPAALSNVLLYHVVEGDVNFLTRDVTLALNGAPLAFAPVRSLVGFAVNNTPILSAREVDNGVVYVIGTVLQPPE